MKNNLYSRYIEEHIQLTSLHQFNEADTLDIIMKLIDYSNNLGVVSGTWKAIQLSKTINPELHFPNERFLFHYYLGVAWGDIRHSNRGTKKDWFWESKDAEQEIKHGRLALKFFDSSKDSLERFCQIQTNLGTALDWIGRFAQAHEHWRLALSQKDFGMAMGAKGHSFLHHGNYTISDQGHANIFKIAGYQFMKKALDLDLYSEARTNYTMTVKNLKSQYGDVIEETISLLPNERIQLNDEIEYRRWCEKNILFLHPINECGDNLNADYDPLSLPNMVYSDKLKGSFHSFYNNIKQEYTSARYLLHEGICAAHKHFSDLGVAKYDLIDCSVYGLSVEKTKVAYRMAYSLFDKVACFLNAYMNLGIEEQKVNFKKIWYAKNEQGKMVLRNEFQNLPNMMFRALFWISKDLHYKKDGFSDTLLPDSKELADIRNCLEHKSLKIYAQPPFERLELPFYRDEISLSVELDEFRQKALRILKMAREAIFYLVYGIHIHEKSKGNHLSVPIFIDMK
ncbi:hypothetical protein GC194_12540 [bacterium]|nr:hypothetical protein [bacterium]